MPNDAPADLAVLVKAITHELANPVSGLVGALELLEVLGEGSPAKRRRYRDLASQTVSKLEDALKDLRHAAVVEGGPVRPLDEAVSAALGRAGRPGRLEVEVEGPVRVTAGARLDELLDRWIAKLAPDATLRIVRPHRFGVWLQSVPLVGEPASVFGEVGAAGGRLVGTTAGVEVFFAYPLAEILP